MLNSALCCRITSHFLNAQGKWGIPYHHAKSVDLITCFKQDKLFKELILFCLKVANFNELLFNNIQNLKKFFFLTSLLNARIRLKGI